MSRQLEQVREEKQKKLDAAVLLSLEGGLVEAVGRAGGDLVGIAIHWRGDGWLAIVKVELAGRRQIAFVGAETLAKLFVKITREANRDKLSWRDDKYAKG